MINAVKTTKAMGHKYKFGVQIPRSVRHAFQLDKKNGNNPWQEALFNLWMGTTISKSWYEINRLAVYGLVGPPRGCTNPTI